MPSERNAAAERATDTLRALRTRGFRMTKLRTALVELLVRSEKPLSALECEAALERSGLTANKTTIYRELDFLLKEGVVIEIDVLDGKKRYERAPEGAPHHHLVCTECKDVECAEVSVDLGPAVRSIQSSRDFRVTGHVLEFFGRCSKCTNRDD